MTQGKAEEDSLRDLIEAAFEQCAARAAAPSWGRGNAMGEEAASQALPNETVVARGELPRVGRSAGATKGAPRASGRVDVGPHVEQGDVPAGGAPMQAANDGAGARQSSVVVGEVLDTHNPHLPGRVLVRWLDPVGQVVDRWLQRERHLSLRKGDNVLVTLPVGWNQWVVTGALGREPRESECDPANERELRLQPGEAVSVVSHDGQRLLTLRQGAEGPVVELGQGNVELAATRTLRLSADTVEITSATGGIDIRSEGDTVVRSRTIRLN